MSLCLFAVMVVLGRGADDAACTSVASAVTDLQTQLSSLSGEFSALTDAALDTFCTAAKTSITNIVSNVQSCPAQAVEAISKLVTSGDDFTKLKEIARRLTMCHAASNGTRCARYFWMGQRTSPCPALNSKDACLANSGCKYAKFGTVFTCVPRLTTEQLDAACNGCVAQNAKVLKTLYNAWRQLTANKPTGETRAAQAKEINKYFEPSYCAKAPDGQYCMLASSIAGPQDESVQTAAAGSLIPVADVDDVCATSKHGQCMKAFINLGAEQEREDGLAESEAAKDDATFKPKASSGKGKAQGELYSKVCRLNNGKRCGQILKETMDVTDAPWLACKASIVSGQCSSECSTIIKNKIDSLGCCQGLLKGLLKQMESPIELKDVAKNCNFALTEVADCTRPKTAKANKLKLSKLKCALLNDPAVKANVAAALQGDIASAINVAPTDVEDLDLVCDSSSSKAFPFARQRNMQVQQSTTTGVTATFALAADDQEALSASQQALSSAISSNSLQLTGTQDASGGDASVNYAESSTSPASRAVLSWALAALLILGALLI